MASPSLIPFVEHFDFSALPLVQVRESFARLENGARRVYAGVQWDRWQKDEFVWSERAGKWSDFIPEPREEHYLGDIVPQLTIEQSDAMRTVTAQLMLAGALVEDYALAASFARAGDSGTQPVEPLLRVPSGTVLKASSSLTYQSAPRDYFPKSATECLLFSAQTGVLAASAGEAGALGVVADGSYLLWASAGNEYSAIRVVVGAGGWAWNSAVFPGPGCPLLRKGGPGGVAVTPANLSQFIVPLDPMARVVSASCVLHTETRTRDGSFDLPVGTLVIGGIRAGRSGPESAIWALHLDGTARLLAAGKTFSNGLCECAKTNHFASDIGQHPDGRLFVLSECGLDLYDPDAPSVFERLTPFPASAHGHPGGNCLRFPAGEITHWTENFGGVNDGTSHYNRLVRRVAGRDLSGPSTLWHGTNCADSFLGRYWAIRCDETSEQLEKDGGTLYLDWLDGGRWHGFEGMQRDTKRVFWQRLRAAMGSLFLFGYAPSNLPGEETPVCAVADGVTLREAAFPFFVRRATPALGSLFVATRSADDGIGAANRVVEITGAKTHICSFWNAADGAFEMSRAAFTAAGGDPAKLPPFLIWAAQAGRGGGGVWRAATSAPALGYFLSLDPSTAVLIRYFARGSDSGGEVPSNALTLNGQTLTLNGENLILN